MCPHHRSYHQSSIYWTIGPPSLFFFNDTATTEIYTLSLHDALPICRSAPCAVSTVAAQGLVSPVNATNRPGRAGPTKPSDRKSTRLNSSHLVISYAVFCLKKKISRSYTTPSSHASGRLASSPVISAS